MAFYDDEEVWKCPQHPSRRRRTGICPVCLREKLSFLCPDCANVRPCSCCATSTSSSSSSSSSSFSRFLFSSDAPASGATGRVSKLIESEPAFRRSRSLAIPFLRVSNESNFPEKKESFERRKSKTGSFWSFFGSRNSNSRGGDPSDRESDCGSVDRRTMMRRSRSVAVDSGGAAERKSLAGKGKGMRWYFPSPIKALRQSRVSKIVQEQSPLYRG